MDISTTLASVLKDINNTSSSSSTVDWTPGLITVFTVDVILVFAAFLLHFIGIIILSRRKQGEELSNQSILLIHLSFVSILNTILNAIAIAVKVQVGKRFPPGYIVCFYIAYMAYILNLIYLSTDRLIFVILTLKYKRVMKEAVLYTSIVMLWLLAISYGLFIKFAPPSNEYNEYAPITYNGFVVTFTALAYIFIIIKVVQSSRTAHSATHKKPIVRIKKYAVPFFIVMTFFVFQMLPHIIANHFPVAKKYSKIRLIGLIGMNVLNTVCDAMVYIFLQPKARGKLFSFLKKPNTKSKKQLQK